MSMVDMPLTKIMVGNQGFFFFFFLCGYNGKENPGLAFGMGGLGKKEC